MTSLGTLVANVTKLVVIFVEWLTFGVKRLSHLALVHAADSSLVIATSIGCILMICIWGRGENLLDNLRSPVVTLKGDDNAPLVRIPSGELVIGSANKIERKKISEFYLQQYDVTNVMFERFVHLRKVGLEAGPPSLFEDRRPPALPDWKDHPELTWRTLLSKNGPHDMAEYPVVGVSWDDATAYCKQYNLRLPTADEWLYAEHAGTKTVYWWGEAIPRFRKIGNFADAALLREFPRFSNYSVVPQYDDGFAKTSPVGRFGANPWGLYDIVGNVWQWVDRETPSCPDQQPEKIKQKARAGGAWSTGPIIYGGDSGVNCVRETMRSDDTGFRCARDVTLPPTAAAHNH